MAKIDNALFNIRGRVGNVVFAKTKNGTVAYASPRIDKKRILKDPAFIRTRQNCEEFSMAAKANAKLRKAMSPMISITTNPQLSNKLQKKFMTIIKSDPVNNMGERVVEKGDLSILHGLELDATRRLHSTILSNIQARLDIKTGMYSIDTGSFKPCHDILAPSGATHFKVKVVVISLSCSQDEPWHTAEHDSEPINVNSDEAIKMLFEDKVDHENPQAILAVMGIAFLQDVSGCMYPISTKQNAAAIIAIQQDRAVNS